MEMISKKISKDDARLSEALDFVLSQQFVEAIQFCERHLGRKKNSALSFVYGHALLRVNRENEGKTHLKKNNLKGVKDAYCLYRMAHLAFELEYYDDAVACYERAIIYEKDFWEAYYNLGNSLKKIFKYKEAERAYLKALKINPAYTDLLYNLAQVYESLNEFQNAQNYYSQVLNISPNDSGAMTGIGRCVYPQNGLEAAEPFWLKAIEINPKSDDAYDAIVNAYISLRDFAKAQHFLDGAIDAGIQHQTIFLNMARILYAGERKADLAKKVLKQGVAYYPRVPELWNMLLGIMIEKSEYNEAEEILNTLFSEGLELWYLKLAMSRLLFETSRITEAENVVKELLVLNPDNGILISSLLAMMAYNPRHSPDELFDAHKHYGALLEANKIGSLENRPLGKKDGEIIKVGYVSPDFREHATSRFMEPIIANHDRDRFHITLYSNIKITDKVTERLKGYADEWVDTVALSDFQLAQKVREDKIDILVDLAGHTPGNRLSVFGYKPAPIQASWMGYPYTTGMQSIDYYFVEPEMVKNGAQACFTEQLKYLCYAEEKTRPCVVDWLPEKTCLNHALASEKNGYVTFGCFNRIEKLSIEMIDVWVEILSTLESSRLRIQNRNFNARHEREKWLQLFVSKGIDEGRLEFMGAESLTEYLNSLGEIDVGLDTFPYNGSTVSLDMLKVGVPFVTLAGSKSHSQTGQALLASKGMAKYIASSYQEYKDTVLDIALNVDERLCIKNALLTETINNTDREWVSKVLEELYLDILPV